MAELEDLLSEYQEKFGEPYLCNPEWQTDVEITEGIKKCLEENIPRRKGGNDPDIIY